VGAVSAERPHRTVVYCYFLAVVVWLVAGIITKAELIKFYTNMYALRGHHKSAEAIAAQVDAQFNSVDKDFSGGLTFSGTLRVIAVWRLWQLASHAPAMLLMLWWWFPEVSSRVSGGVVPALSMIALGLSKRICLCCFAGDESSFSVGHTACV
jgi:hypothetical protein